MNVFIILILWNMIFTNSMDMQTFEIIMFEESKLVFFLHA